MNHKTFIETIQASGRPDRYGWVTRDFGRYRFRTNGAEWTCLTLRGNHPVTRLDVIITEWKQHRDRATKTAG